MRIVLFAVASLLCLPECGIAQEFRVYTTVRDADTTDEPIVSRSLTMFRGGKSYDWLEAIGEVVVSDRVRGTSVVLSRQLDGTKVERDQLAHFLKIGRSEAEDYVQSMSDPAAQVSVGFTLKPRFETVYQPELERLTMTGGGWTYTITTAEPPDPAIVAAYLDYADRAAAMNFLIHPRATFPAMRQAVNAKLREIGRLPLTVHLQRAGDAPLSLRAEHKYDWALQSFDHSQIRRWDGLVRDDSKVRWVDLRNFQRQTLAAD